MSDALMRWLAGLLRWLAGIPTRRHKIVIGRGLWERMRIELGRRGLNGSREAGAFLLSDPSGDRRRVLRVAYYDDLDPGCLIGHIRFRARGYSRLWAICEAEGLRVVADVHTHPAAIVAQSDIDRAHPMIARSGHIALVLPHFGTRPVEAKEVGVHEFRGAGGWRSWFGDSAGRVLRLRDA